MTGPETLIQRQTRHVEALRQVCAERIRRGYMGGDLAGKRAKLNRAHIEEMRAAGYSQREAAESAQQCWDMAWLEESHAQFQAGFA